MVDAIRQTFARGALVLLTDAAQQFVNLLNRLGRPDEDEVECAHHGALSPRGGRCDLSGATCGVAPSRTPGWWPGMGTLSPSPIARTG